MKKIIFILILITSFSSYADSSYECGKPDPTSGSQVWNGCGYGSVNVTWSVSGLYDTQAEAQAIANADLVTFRAANPDNTSYGIYSDLWSGVSYAGQIWGAIRVSVYRCASSNRYHKNHYFFYKKSTWIDQNNDCILDGSEQAGCLKYKPLMKVLDKTSGCLYFAKIMDENCNVSVLGDSSIINKAMSGDVDVQIQSFSAPSRNTESTCSMTLPYYDCNNGFTETACSGYNLSHDDNKNNPQVQNIENGQSTQNQNLTDPQSKQSGDTDSTLLGKIVDNTGAIVTNQQAISDQVTQIANLIQDQKSFDAELSNNDLINDNQARDDQAKLAHDSVISDLPTADDYKDQSEFNESDEYNTGIDDKIEEVSPDGTVKGVIDKYADNTILTGFRNSRIEIINPVCSIEIPFSLWGYTTTIQISACQWDSLLTQTGNILYVICCIGCFLMVLRGK
jgi:hypothetical protein